MVALSSHSFRRWYLTHWRSFAALSAGSSAGGASHTSAPSCAVDRANDIPPLWQVIVGFPSLGYLHIQASLPRLLLWWPSPRDPSAGVVPYTLVFLRSAFGRWCLLLRRSSTALSWPFVCPPRSSSAGGGLRPSGSSTLLLNLEVIFQKPQITKNTNTTVTSKPSSPETFDQSFTIIV